MQENKKNRQIQHCRNNSDVLNNTQQILDMQLPYRFRHVHVFTV